MKKTLALLFLCEICIALGFSLAEAQAKTISQTSGNGQTGTIGTSLSQPFVVTITDSLGDPVSGVPVNFSVAGTPSGATGQSLSVTSASTDLNGQATSLLTLGSKVGTYSVSATSTGLTGSPIGFTATGLAGPAKNITLTSGDGQSGAVTTALANPFVVTVTDIGGNPVAGRSVTFTIATIPPGATGQSLSVAAVNTDLNGQASTVLTLGTKKGTYTVSAASMGLVGSPVIFTATGTPGPATQVRVETLADGSGAIILPQNLPSGSSLTGYAITRDANDNFIANVAADAWAIINRTGGVSSADLVPSGDMMSVVMAGDTAGSGQIQATEGLLTRVPTGKITVIAGTPTKIRVETKADGSGKVVPDTTLASGTSLTGYAIARDAKNNFAGNIAADTWSLQSKLGGVLDGDLVASGDRKSAIFSAHVIGSAQVRATFGILTPTQSGTISVTVGTAAKVRVETKADGTGKVVPDTSLPSGSAMTVYAITRDGSDNFVANVAANAWSLNSKLPATGGVVDGDLVASGDRRSATFTGRVIGSAKIQATAGVLPVVTSGVVTVTAGTASKVRVETKADGTGTVFPSQTIPSGGRDTAFAIARDASDNFVANVPADAWSLINITGGILGSDLVPSGDARSAIFTAHATGTAQISMLYGVLPVTNSGVFTVATGTAVRVKVETKADGTGTVVAAQTLLASRSITVYAVARDTADNFVANVAADAWAIINRTGGVSGADLFPSGDRKSATFIGDSVGSGQIQVSSGTLTKTPSGTITVVLGTPASIRVETKADGTGTIVPAQTILASRSITAYAIARDSSDNFVASVAADAGWSMNPKSGGVADSNLTVAPDKKSVIFTAGIIGSGSIQAKSTTLTSVSSGTITVALGTTAKVQVETKADGSGTIISDQVVPSGDSLEVYAVTRDSANNFVANVAATAWSLTAKTGAVVDGDLVHSTDMKSAVFHGHGLGSARIQAASGILPSVSSGQITVGIGAPAKLVFVQQPSTVVSQAVMTPPVTVRIEDASGNLVADGRNVTLTLLNNAAGGTLGGTTTVTAIGGVATFGNLTVDKADSHYTILASSVPELIRDTSNAFIVQPGALSTFAVEDSAGGNIPTQNAGVAFKVRISARDAAGNIARSFAGTVNVSANGGGILSAGGGTTLAFTDGVLAAHTVSFSNTGNFSLSVRNTLGFNEGISNVFAVTAGSPGQVVFVQQPTNAVAGATITPAVSVQLQDALGNNIFLAGVSITLDLESGTGLLFGTKTRPTNSSGIAIFSNLSVDSAGVKRMRALSGLVTPAISDSFIISAGSASKLGFAVNPGPGLGGQLLTIQPVVSLQDQYGNTVTGTAETVTLAIQNNPSEGILGGTRTIPINTLTGQAAFTNLTIDKAGLGYTLTATGQNVSTSPGVVVSAPFDVGAGVAAKLAFSVQPTNTVAGVAINPAVVVQVQDWYGNPVLVNDTLITLSMDSTGSLGGNVSRSTIAGLATFNDLRIDKEGTKVLKASGTGLVSVFSSPFTISPAPAARLSFSTQPGGGVAGLPLSPQPVLTLQDAFGNTVRGTAQEVTISLKDTAGTGASLGGTKAVAVSQATGTATFTNLSIDKAGVGYTLTAVGSTVDTTHGVVVSQPVTVIAGSPKKLRVETLPDGKGTVLVAQNVSSGFPISVYAIGRDSLGNFVANVPADQWKLVDTAGGAKQSDLVPSSDRKSAVFTGSAIGSSARIYASLSSLTPDTSGVLSVVQAGTAAKILVETAPNGTGTVVPAQSIVSGGSITVYAVGRDAANNFVGNLAAESWSLEVLSGTAPPQDIVPAADKRSAVFTAHRMGKVRIVAAQGTLTQVPSDTIRVTPGTPASIAVASKSPDSARVASYFASRLVTLVRDSSGNPVRDVPVTYTVPASGPSSLFDGGVHTAITDSLGQAASRPLKANTVIGQFADTARVTGISGHALFMLQNLAGLPHTITTVAGTPDTTEVATAFPLPLSVAVRDSFGNPVDSVRVTFSAPTSGPSGTFPGGILTNSAFTNSQGVATSAIFVANILAGTYSVNATVPTVVTPASFSLTNKAGAAGSVTAAAGTQQSAVVATAFNTRFQALVKDGAGNTVSHVLVHFTAPSSGPSGTFTGGLTDTARTNTSGVATASVYTADTVAGTYNVLATVDGITASAAFALTNIPGTVDTFAVEAAAGGDLPTQTAQVPFGVRITARDMYNNVATGFIGTVNITSNGPILTGGGKTTPFTAGVLDSHAVSMQAAGSVPFVLTATRNNGAETGRSNPFQVVNPAPVVKSITPSNGLRGQTVNVVILGGGFISGVTSVTFGDQITTSTVVTNDSTMTVRLTIDPAAALGARNVTVFNAPPGGSPPYIKVGGFIVGENPIPTVVSITPDSAAQSQVIRATLTGTNFIGASQVMFVPSTGMTVDSVAAIDSLHISLKISVSGSAAIGRHDIVVTNPPPAGGADTLLAGFRVTAGGFYPPLLVSPAHGSQGLSSPPLLTWQAALGAVGYDLQVATDTTFASSVIIYDYPALTATSQQVGPLTLATTYYWHVRSRNAGGGISAWCAAWSFDNVAYPQSYALTVNVDFPVHTNATDYAQTDYQLIGLPGAQNGSLSTLLSGQVGVDWQAYWDNGGQANYLVAFSEGDPTFTFAAGRGFWLIKKGPWTLTNQVVNSAPLRPSTSAVHVKLHSGWNILTNPFLGRMDWTALKTANGISSGEILWGWKLDNGAAQTWYQSTPLEPYKAYYFYNDPGANPVLDTLKFPYGLSIGKKASKIAEAAADTNAWRVTVDLKVGKYQDLETSLGVSTLAAQGKNRFDSHKPRPFAEMPALYFDRPDWDRYYSTFASDIRAPFDKIASWELTVSTPGPKAGPAELNFHGIENVPGQFGVYLIDEVGACYRNLRLDGAAYKFVPPAPTAHFKVLVGTKEAIEQEVAKIVPHAFALDQNYPNPFNPSTTIPVSVPYAADVTLKIYNIIGEEVATVYSGMLEPGKHRFTWEGRNGAGAHVASGVYFVRMTTNSGPSFVGKMLLMK